MNLGWQDIVAISVVFCAGAYLARLSWGAVAGGKSSGCAKGCGSCPTNTSSQSSEGPSPADVVTIGSIGRSG